MQMSISACNCPCESVVSMISVTLEYLMYNIPESVLLQSFVCSVYRTGEIAEPCGAPVETVLDELRLPLTWTLCCLSVRNKRIQRIRYGFTSIWSSFCPIRQGCVVFKALEKSTNTSLMNDLGFSRTMQQC